MGIGDCTDRNSFIFEGTGCQVEAVLPKQDKFERHCEQVHEQATGNMSCIAEVAALAEDLDMAQCPARQSSRSSPVSLSAPPAPGMWNRRIS